MGIGVMLLDLELAFVVQEAVEDKGRVTVGALDGQTVERRVVVSDEGVKLQRRNR